MFFLSCSLWPISIDTTPGIHKTLWFSTHKKKLTTATALRRVLALPPSWKLFFCWNSSLVWTHWSSESPKNSPSAKGLLVKSHVHVSQFERTWKPHYSFSPHLHKISGWGWGSGSSKWWKQSVSCYPRRHQDNPISMLCSIHWTFSDPLDMREKRVYGKGGELKRTNA